MMHGTRLSHDYKWPGVHTVDHSVSTVCSTKCPSVPTMQEHLLY